MIFSRESFFYPSKKFLAIYTRIFEHLKGRILGSFITTDTYFSSVLLSARPSLPRFQSSFNHSLYTFIKGRNLLLFLQYECAATKQVSKNSTIISTIKYSLGRLMRTNANWLVCYNTQGRAQKMGGEGRGGELKMLCVCRENEYPEHCQSTL